MPAERERSHRHAVEAIPAANDDLLLRFAALEMVLERHLDCVLVGLGTARTEEDAVHALRRESLDDQARTLLNRLGREGVGRGEGKARRLRSYGLDHLRHPMPDRRYRR